MAVSTITETSKGGLITVVPSELRKLYGLRAGQKLIWTPLKNGKFVVERI